MAKKSTTKTKSVAAKTSKTVKPTKRKTAPKTKVVELGSMPEPVMENTNRRWYVVGLVILALGVAAYYLKGYAIAAMVNGQPVSRISVIRELEKMDDGQVLDGIITQTLIAQAAKKAGITADPAAADEELKNIEEQVKTQGQDLDQLLAMQGMTRDTLKEQISIQKTVEKLAGADTVTVTDEEVKKFATDNASLFPKTLKPEELTARASDQLKRQKVQEKIQAYIEELRTAAKIEYLVNYN